ncbi:hypothetical protein C8A01DRAFT_50798 [Parachaetomium inaequale]|uniref:Protein CAP22 n=1 Tax=Parachaetomium inaequale TaxID=2588326 RepID=A0AAN6P660_9PEZI|nr:hypothetical protein C8A01DRAFT_50798 [Parachaetomium inaequale]
MHTTAATTLFLAVIVSLVHAEELKASDVPNACKAICGPMVTLTSTCDVDPDTETRRRRLRHRADDDNTADDESDEVVEAQCICNNTSFNVRSVAALCAACISQNGKTTDDMDKIISQCSFSSTTFIPGAITAVAGVTVKATKPAFTTSGSSTPTGSNSGSGAGGSTPKASSTGTSAGVMSFDLKTMRLGLAAAAVGAASFLFF